MPSHGGASNNSLNPVASMTPDQFKAWFEGFCEAIDGSPTPGQWAKIKAKAADIGGRVLFNPGPDQELRLPDHFCYPGRSAGISLVKKAGLESELRLSDQFFHNRLTGADLGPRD